LAEADAVAFRGDMVELFQRDCRGFHTNVVVADIIKGILQVRSLFFIYLFKKPHNPFLIIELWEYMYLVGSKTPLEHQRELRNFS
jgi:hypothetical protein